MANIYDAAGYSITEGLQGCTVCDEALQIARDIAADRRQPVFLEDDNGDWLIFPNGDIDEA